MTVPTPEQSAAVYARIDAEKAEKLAARKLRGDLEALVLVFEAKYGIQSSPVAHLRSLLDGAT